MFLACFVQKLSKKTFGGVGSTPSPPLVKEGLKVHFAIFTYHRMNDCEWIYDYRAGGTGPTTPTLVGPKILPFMVKALCFQSFGRTDNCQIDALFRWSDQSCTPSTINFDAFEDLQTAITYFRVDVF